MKILISGGTGFIGSALCDFLSKEGHELIILTRYKKTDAHCVFDYLHPKIPKKVLSHLEGVINLAGEDLAESRWSKEKKERIYDSRVLYTRALVEILNKELKEPLKFFISASAVGHYGQTKKEERFTEDSPHGKDFLSHVCHDWEEEAKKLSQTERLAIARFGLVLGKEGGFLKRVLPLYTKGAGGHIGQGKQWMSWIHREDLLRAFLFLIEHHLEGEFNFCAPHAVKGYEFSKTLGSVLKKPAFMHVPEPMIRLMFGEMSDLLFSSQNVFPKKLLQHDFSFKYEHLDQALKDILKT